MKTGTIQLGNASLHISYSGIVKPNQRGNAREITELFVPKEHRGKGEGSALMKDVCAQADQDKLLLLLTADTPELGIFYAKLGFRVIQQNPMLMARSPE